MAFYPILTSLKSGRKTRMILSCPFGPTRFTSNDTDIFIKGLGSILGKNVQIRLI